MTTEATGRRAALILLARMDSRRLPGKGLLDLGGRSILGLAADRLKQARVVSDVIIATSDRDVDAPLAEFAAAEGIGIFRGDTHNVAKRCQDCCQAFDLDWFVRICGDSPFADPAIVDRVAGEFLDKSPDIATNVHPRSYPIGASAEAVSRDAIGRICAETDDLSYLEHVTAWAYAHPERYAIVNVSAPDRRYEGLSTAVDTPEDLARARNIVARLDDPVHASLDDVVALIEAG